VGRRRTIFLAGLAVATLAAAEERPRARDIGIAPGVHEPGPRNAITDVDGVLVGHVTVRRGTEVRTGVTAILPHGGNVFQEKVPAAIVAQNGFGKLIGYTQVRELGEIETPILLTNTLAAWDAAAAAVDYTLRLAGNETVRSVNPVVGETNDAALNDIRGRPLTREDFLKAIELARGGPVAEGAVGAGLGTVAFGFKGGIGTSSRRLPVKDGGFTVGVLVQTNMGGRLTIDGVPVWKDLGGDAGGDAEGSCMIVVATDAPLDARRLERLARRTFAGMARTGASFSHGSGDYAIAFSSSSDVRIRHQAEGDIARTPELRDDRLSPLFEAAAEATEEAIYNSLLQATDTQGKDGAEVKALPVPELNRILEERGGG
jgi:D-aminopeptidase